jgi:hypothetical protein
VIIVAGRQSLTFKQGLAGRTLTAWADLHSIHLLLNGHVLRTVASRLLPQDLAFLSMRGARQAGPEPARAAIGRRGGKPVLAAGQAVEISRKVHRDGRVVVNKQFMKLGPRHAGKLVTVIIEDTCCRVLHGEEEIAVKPRNDTSPITRLYVRGMKT